MYVAMTRARNHLAVSYPLNVYSSRRSMDYSMDQLSRFVDRGVREQMERVVLGDDDKPDTTAPPPVPESPIDLRALLLGRFSRGSGGGSGGDPDGGTSGRGPGGGGASSG